MRVNEQFAGSSAALHPDPAGLAGLEDGAVDRGVVGRGRGEPGAVEVGRLERAARRRVSATGVAPRPHLGAELGRDDVHVGTGVEQRLDLAGRDAPAADDDAAAARDEQVDRVPAEARSRLPGRRPSSHALRRRARRVRAGAVGRRRGSGARSRGRPCAATPSRGTVTHRGREVEDRPDAGARRAGRRPPARRPAGVAITPIATSRSATIAVEVVDRLDRELADPAHRPSRDRRRRAPRCESRGRRSRGSWRARARGCRGRRSRPASRG